MTLAVATTAAPSSPALASLATVERVVALVDDLLADLQPYTPGARPRRSRNEGRWLTGITLGGGIAGRLPFSRLEVEIAPSAAGAEVWLKVSATVRDRDLPRCELNTALDEAGWARLGLFLETSFLAFAERWFLRD